MSKTKKTATAATTAPVAAPRPFWSNGFVRLTSSESNQPLFVLASQVTRIEGESGGGARVETARFAAQPTLVSDRVAESADAVHDLVRAATALPLELAAVAAPAAKSRAARSKKATVKAGAHA